jgi:hypothetical protein
MSPYKKLHKLLKNKFSSEKILSSDIEYILFINNIFGTGVDISAVINDMITLNYLKNENGKYSLV